VTVDGALPLTAAGSRRGLQVRRVAIVLLMFVAFFWVYFQRMGMAVIAADLEASFGLSAAALGLLGAAYFYPYALIQLPVGVLVDRIGSRWILTLFVAVAGAGSLLFAVAGDFGLAVVGRLLVGVGVGAVWLSAQRLFVNWYHPRQFATLNGLMNAVGNLGGIAGQLPLAVVAAAIGWQTVFAGAGVVGLGLALLCLLLVIDRPPAEALSADERARPAVAVPKPSVRRDLRSVLGSRDLWLLAVALLPYVGSRFGFQSLWGGPFFADVHHLSTSETGTLLMLMSLSLSVASVTMGYLSDRVFSSRKRLSVVGMCLYCLCWVPLTFAPAQLSMPMLYLLVIALGVLSSFWIPIYAQAKELFSPAVAGTALAVVNLFSTFGGAAYQQIMGVVIGLFPSSGGGYSATAYSAAFGVCLAGVALSTLLVALSREKK
jgi:sugar phosphate permease